MAALESSAKNIEGLRLEQSGDYEGAVQAFTEALTLNPELTAAYWNRAKALRLLGRAADAQVDNEKGKSLVEHHRRVAAQPEFGEGNSNSEGHATEGRSYPFILVIGLAIGITLGGLLIDETVGFLVGFVVGGGTGGAVQSFVMSRRKG